MEPQRIAHLLSKGLSNNNEERTNSERELTQLSKVPGYCVALIQIAGSNEVPLEVRLVAAITFKRHTQNQWVPEKDDRVKEEAAEVHAAGDYTNDADRLFVRTHIVDALTYSPPKIQAQLSMAFRNIARLEWPAAWPELTPQLMSYITSKDMTKTHGALLSIRLIVRNYEYINLPKKRVPLENLVENMYPILLLLLQSLSDVKTEGAGQMILLIVKCFWSSSNFGMPKHLAQESVMVQWMTQLLKQLEDTVPPGEPADPDLRKDFVWWKIKRWVSKTFDRLFNRYGDAEKLNLAEAKSFSKQFLKLYAPKLLEVSLRMLFAMKNGTYLPSRIIYSCLSFVNHAVRNKNMYPRLKPQADQLFREILFPLLCFSEADMELWRDDPEEYLRKEYNVFEEFYAPKCAASLIVIDLGRNRGKNHLNSMMTFVGQTMMRYSSEPEGQKKPQEKDGAMAVIADLEDKLRAVPEYAKQLERILVDHVFPEFSSPHPWLRAKACYVFGSFFRLEWSNPENYKAGLRLVLKCVVDPELPVRVRAVMALQHLIANPLSTEEIRKILPQLIEEFFKIMNEIDNDELVLTLKLIIEHFSEEMGPYSIGLCTRLSQVFMKICDNDDENEDSAMAALETLDAMQTILRAIQDRPELYPPIEELLLPVMRYTMSPDAADFFEEGAKLVTYITYFGKTISPEMWSLFPKMHERFNECTDFIQDLLNPFDNYISRSTETFLTGGPYLQMVSEMYKKILLNDNEAESNCIDACKLIEVVLLNCRGRVDQFIEPYIQIALARLPKATRDNLKCLLIGVVVNSMYYNPILTLEILARNNWTEQFFSVWFQHVSKLPRTFDKKLTILTLLTLVNLPENVCPALVRGGFSQIIETMITTCHDLVRHKQILAAAAEEDDDDFDGASLEDELEETEGDINAGLEDNDNEGEMFDDVKEVDFDDDFDAWDDDDLYDDDEECTTPLDHIDESKVLLEYIASLQTTQPAFYNTVVANQNLSHRLNELGQGKCTCEVQSTEK